MNKLRTLLDETLLIPTLFIILFALIAMLFYLRPPWRVYSIFCPPGWGEVIARNRWTGEIRNYTTGLPVTVPDGCFWAEQPQLHFGVKK